MGRQKSRGFMRETLGTVHRRITAKTGALPTRHRADSTHNFPMASIYETLRADIITSMKARDNATTLALRTADAGIKRAAMDTNKEIDDPLTIATMRKMVKNL